MAELQETTPYDDVFKTQKTECPRLLIPVINEVFHKKYKENVEIIGLENEIFLRKQDGYEEKRLTDAVVQIRNERKQAGRSYHIECQSTKDTSMGVRMYEYDSQIALMDGEWDGKSLKVKFPYSAIIYLRSDNTMGENIKMKLNTPENEVGYQIPLIKLKDYSLDMIFEKHLFILLPFWIFTYESRLAECEKDEEQRSNLKEDFRTIMKRLQQNCENGIINEYTKCMIVDMSKKVVRNLLGDKFPKVRKEVEAMMGGKVLDFEAKRIKDQAIKEGLEEGRTKGLIEGRAKGRVEGRAEGRAEGRLEGEQATIKKSLKVLIDSLKKFSTDLETVYNAVVENELYKDITKEQVEKYFYAK